MSSFTVPEVDAENTLDAALRRRRGSTGEVPTANPPSETISHHQVGGLGSVIEYLVTLESLAYDPPIRATGKAYNEALARENAQAAYSTAVHVRESSKS